MNELNEEYIERIWEEAKQLFLEEDEDIIATLITLAYSDGVDAEREACAKVCDGWRHADGDLCATAIRARGEL